MQYVELMSLKSILSNSCFFRKSDELMRNCSINSGRTLGLIISRFLQEPNGRAELSKLLQLTTMQFLEPLNETVFRKCYVFDVHY